MRIIFPYACFFAVAVAITSCKPHLTVPVPSAGETNVSKVVAIGDNFLSGYQDGALYRKGQQLSIPSLLCRQFAYAGGGTFIQPLISDEHGIGLNLDPFGATYVSCSKLGYKTDCNGVSGLFPLNSVLSATVSQNYLATVSPSINNFSASFLKTSELFNPQAGSAAGNVFLHRFASAPGTSTVLSDAMAAHPTFFVAWAGMEDIFSYARHGGYQDSIMPASQFSVYLDSLLSTLTSTGGKGVLANIPDLESFPFFTLIPSRGLDLTQKLADSLNTATGEIFNYSNGKNGFAIQYPVNSGQYRQMGAGEYLLLNIPLDSLKCGKMGVFFDVPNYYSLDSSEVAIIHQSIQQYNLVISQKAAQYHLALADMNTYFKSLQSGIKWNGADLNAQFISGGFFSLDGYHPNQIGYSLIANQFLKAINDTYKASFPPINCTECDGILFP